ncbi:MAG TPA: lysylphosphatidylglycerol synthase transmembrane domain-containing protein [Candidatus Limnocylindria bacterium]|jgi:uncharacterized protein (TIRG00374 family)|nr:lysylphosphatidylglycerol synthase transmembrane domain-containing protein [Candidatus Limnocylindria bacterium]
MVLCFLLMGLVMHVIFSNDAQLYLIAKGQPDAWNQMDVWSQRRLAWSRGPAELWSNFSRLNHQSLGLAWVLSGLLIFFGGVRWREVLRVQGLNMRLNDITQISLIAHLFNAFLLGSTGGDVWKAYAAAQATHHKKAEAAVTVFVDRVIGILALLLFAMVFAIPNWRLIVEYKRYLAAVMMVASMTFAALAAVVIGFYSDALSHEGWIARMFHRLPKGDSIAKGLASCRLFGRRPGFMWKMALWSILMNIANIGTYVAVAHGLKLQLPASVLWFVVPAVVCISAVPVTPSGLGVRENLFVWLLAIPAVGFNVKYSEALSVSLLGYTISITWSLVGLGIYMLRKRAHMMDTQDAVE